MSTTTTVRSWPAIGLGAFFAGVTGYVLFEDVFHGASITTGHVQTVAALIAAIAAGHMAVPSLRSRSTILPGIGLVLLALAATLYITVTSGARNAEIAGNKVASINEANKARAREEAALARSQDMLDKANSKLADECASGPGKRCRGVKATVDVYTAAIAGHNAKLASLPAPTVNGYAHAAKVLSSWGVAVTDEWLSLNMPFIVVLIAELGTVAFLHLGLGHKPAPQPAEPDWKDEDLMPAPEEQDKVISYVKAFEAKNGRKPQIPEVQAMFPEVSRATVHRRIRAA